MGWQPSQNESHILDWHGSCDKRDCKCNPATECDAFRAASAGYDASVTMVINRMVKVATKPEPRRMAATKHLRFERLPVGACFHALREEIQTAQECQQAADALGLAGTVHTIKTDDYSTKPSRCYLDHLSNNRLVFNERESAHDAEDGKYEKICGEYVDAAELGARDVWPPVIQGQDRKRNIIQLQLLDVEALNITTNEDYWFVTGDGSRQACFRVGLLSLVCCIP